MWLFGKSDKLKVSKEAQLDQQDRAMKTMAALERGRIPPYIEQHILQQREGGVPWTSDLSVNEWLLLKQIGLRPLGMVMGSSVYHIGWTASNYKGSWSSRSIPDVENALLEVRQRALKRMKEEARMLGAHAVVGVRLDSHLPGFASHQTEFTAFGTAVALDGQEVPDEPLLCTVSALDFMKLLQAGSIPISIGLGISAYYQYTTRQDKWQTTNWSNQEILTYTDSVYQVRHLAMRQLRQQIRDHGGDGVLASKTYLRIYEIVVERGENDDREDHVLEFVASGTIISTSPKPLKPTVDLVLSLQDALPKHLQKRNNL